MDKNTIINQVVENAYENLTSLVKYNINANGGYFGMIINKQNFDSIIDYINDITNSLYIKFCDNIYNNISDDDIEFIMYKSFCFNNPSEQLINDCFDIVNNDIKAKKSRKQTTPLTESLESLRGNYNEDEIHKTFDTIFDILLDYYSIIQK